MRTAKSSAAWLSASSTTSQKEFDIMRTGICAIVKNEDGYVDDWIRYHLKLGID